MPKLIVDQQGRILSNGSGMLMGFDNIPPIVVLSNLPANPTAVNSADITVGGEDVVTYKYKLDNGSYSAETPVSSHIQLSSLSSGSHTLYVIGKDSAGNWNPEISATTHAWTVSSFTLDGLALHYDVGDPLSYPSPYNGTSLGDLAGSFTGTLYGGVAYNSNNGGSLIFDGTDDYVRNSAYTTKAFPKTFTAWVYPHSLSNWKPIVREADGTLLRIMDGVNKFEVWSVLRSSSGVCNYARPSLTFTLNAWNHVAICLASATSGTIYVNNVAQTLSFNSGTTFGSGDVGFQVGRGDTGRVFDGGIADVCVYTRALSATEIQNNFNAYRGRFGL